MVGGVATQTDQYMHGAEMCFHHFFIVNTWIWLNIEKMSIENKLNKTSLMFFIYNVVYNGSG